MKFFYDMHIHSDLSPCGEKDMTPNNIVNMAFIKGLNLISVTDHNTVENFKAVESIAKQIGIYVIPGMEVTTREEVHVLCYFPDYNSAKIVSDLIYDSLPDVKNKIDIFGEQNIYNENDEIIGKLDKLLISASKYSLSDLDKIVKENCGILVPAHVNKKNNGILGVLGFFPLDVKFDYIEVSDKYEISERNKKSINKYRIFKNSDAHSLEDISEPENYFEIDDMENLFDIFKIV